LVCLVTGRQGTAWVPARSAATIPVLEVIQIEAGGRGDSARQYDARIGATVDYLRGQARAALGSLTLEELVRQSGGVE
jgi:hypothetical protein